MTSRRTLVTGAASGIGAALAGRLADAGEEVVGVDRRAGDGIIACDLSDESAIAALARECGAVDAIAHVAGVPGTFDPASIVRVNFLAIRQLSDALHDALMRADRPAIVSVSSITAHRCDLPDARLAELVDAPAAEIQREAATMDGTAAYAFSKKLLNVWTKVQAARLIGAGCRVNAVAPGPVETAILDDFRRSMGADRIAAAEKLAGRHGTPDEIAAAIQFLLSPAARWVNGVVLDCDGGFGAARFVNSIEQEGTR
ncbi:MAG: SDR family oxidoreductase [Parerythrobacter sp.]